MNILNKNIVSFIIVFLAFLYFIYASFFDLNTFPKRMFLSSLSFFSEIKLNLRDSFQDGTSIFKKKYQLELENKILKQKVKRLQKLVYYMYEVENENKRLRRLLKLKDKGFKSNIIYARVILRDPTNWFNFVILDKGYKDGVIENMVVLTDKGLAGIVKEVYSNSCKVVLLTSKDNAISVRLKQSNKVGILYGDGKGFCYIKYITKNTLVYKGDFVLTSGYSRYYPKDIFIGIIVDIKRLTNSNFLKIKVKPLVDLDSLDEVFIIKK